MSYILEALRRAQAERERGQVPGVHAAAPLGDGPPAPGAGSTAPAARTGWRRLGLPMAVAAVTVLVVAALGVSGWVGTGHRPGAGPASPSGFAAVAPGAAGRSATAPDPVAPAARAASAPSTISTASPSEPDAAARAAPPLRWVSAAPSAPAAPAVPAVTASVPASLPVPLPVPGRAPTAAANATPPAGPAAASAPFAVTPLAQLGAEERRAFPALVLGGGIWSEQPASRFVLIGGQVMREGDSPQPGLVVVRIGPRSVWLRWRDRVVEVPI